MVLAAFTFFLPASKSRQSAENLTWHERLGLDALTLLKNRDHRVVFFTTTLLCIPLASFYPYAPANLRDLGLAHTSAWMSLAQISEIIAMFSMGWLLLTWRLKWIFACGLGFGVLRFVLSAVNDRSLVAGGYRDARCVLRPRLCHRSNLSRPACGPGVAGAGAGVADA